MNQNHYSYRLFSKTLEKSNKLEIIMKSALIVIDFINEIVDPKGKLAGKGYAAFIEQASI